MNNPNAMTAIFNVPAIDTNNPDKNNFYQQKRSMPAQSKQNHDFSRWPSNIPPHW